MVIFLFKNLLIILVGGIYMNKKLFLMLVFSCPFVFSSNDDFFQDVDSEASIKTSVLAYEDWYNNRYKESEYSGTEKSSGKQYFMQSCNSTLLTVSATVSNVGDDFEVEKECGSLDKQADELKKIKWNIVARDFGSPVHKHNATEKWVNGVVKS